VTFETVEWPDGQDAKAFVQSQEVIQGSVASRYLPARVPVARNSIESNMGESNGVVESIPRGMRAITVSVNRESAIEGWAQSGNFVDVIALTKSNSGLGLEAQVIAENIKILSAGRSSSRRDIGSTAPKAPDTVTLLCEQEDCLKIRMASRIGSITFSLRGIQDVGPATSVALTQQKLLGNSKKVRAKRFDYNGFAKGPGGEVYLLTRESAQWVKKGEETSDSTKLTTRRMLERARMTAEAGTYD
jgi:Flp pilus assembly protein CpaB